MIQTFKVPTHTLTPNRSHYISSQKGNYFADTSRSGNKIKKEVCEENKEHY